MRAEVNHCHKKIYSGDYIRNVMNRCSHKGTAGIKGACNTVCEVKCQGNSEGGRFFPMEEAFRGALYRSDRKFEAKFLHEI